MLYMKQLRNVIKNQEYDYEFFHTTIYGKIE